MHNERRTCGAIDEARLSHTALRATHAARFIELKVHNNIDDLNK